MRNPDLLLFHFAEFREQPQQVRQPAARIQHPQQIVQKGESRNKYKKN